MPDQVPGGVRQVAEPRRFLRKLLDPVLPKNADASRVGLTHRFGRERLAHAHQNKVIGRAPNTPYGRENALLDSRDVARYGHRTKLHHRRRWSWFVGAA